MAKMFGALMELDNGEMEEHMQLKAAGTQEESVQQCQVKRTVIMRTEKDHYAYWLDSW